MNSHEKSQKNEEIGAIDWPDWPDICFQQPWETPTEHDKFMIFMLLPPGRRSVRNAYKLWCERAGIKPKKDAPSSWYRLYHGETLAVRRLDALIEKIQQALAAGRGPVDHERIMAAAWHQGDLTGDEWHDQNVIARYYCWALALDENGDPIPDCPTWAEMDTDDTDKRDELWALYYELTKEMPFYQKSYQSPKRDRRLQKTPVSDTN